MRQEIKFCQRCYNVADADICSICSNSLRKQELICVVESIREVIAIESTQQYSGTYHVLGGIISPLDGIGPDQLNIEGLVNRVKKEAVQELIFALNPTIQGDTTIYYIQKKLQGSGVKVTTIARGIAFGGELEYADEMTLAAVHHQPAAGRELYGRPLIQPFAVYDFFRTFALGTGGFVYCSACTDQGPTPRKKKN